MHVLALALAIATFAGSLPRVQDDDHDRGLYIGSRPKVSTPAPRRPAGRTSSPPPNRNKPGDQPVRKLDPVEPIGLGFSLYRVLDRERAERVDPSGTFHEGDKLRFLLEPSISGYLYVFVVTGTGAPVMIYPDARLEGGDNYVYAHGVAEVPSRRNPKFDIFRITGGPATERVVFVVSRTPLSGVPIGDELARYCESGTCPWSPSSAAWDAIASGAAPDTRVSTKRDSGTVLSRIEQDALTRDLQLGSSDPEPTVIAINASADAPVLVHQVSIRHE